MPASPMKLRSLPGVLWDRAGMLALFLLMFAVLSFAVPNFFTWANMIELALSVSMVGMVACTMLLCLASGDFDLSVEAVVASAGVLAAVVIGATNSVTLGVAAGVFAGGVVGLINGVVIAHFRVNALITTLSTMQIVRGLGFIVAGGAAVPIVREEFFVLGMGSLFSVPYPVWMTLVCFVLFAILLNHTAFGRHTLAIGGNREATRFSGIPVERVKVVIFALQGLMAGFAGVILASRFTSGQPNSSVGFSLDVISACVLGGVSLSGGIGTVTGVVVGVLIMGTVQDVMNLLNVPTFSQYVARGVILLAAVIFDQLKNRFRR